MKSLISELDTEKKILNPELEKITKKSIRYLILTLKGIFEPLDLRIHKKWFISNTTHEFLRLWENCGTKFFGKKFISCRSLIPRKSFFSQFRRIIFDLKKHENRNWQNFRVNELHLLAQSPMSEVTKEVTKKSISNYLIGNTAKLSSENLTSRHRKISWTKNLTTIAKIAQLWKRPMIPKIHQITAVAFSHQGNLNVCHSN